MKVNISQKISEKYYLWVIVVLAIVFFFIYSYFSFGHNLKFNSPDESANYFFISRFVEDSTFKYYEPLNAMADSMIHPRNMIVLGENIVPFTFLGFYLILGFIGKLFGVGALLFITPMVSSVSCVFFYLLIKEIFGKKLAFVSTVILFTFPAFWFLSSRPMHNNALLTALFIISYYFLVKMIKDKKLILYILFGIFFALTLMVRASEIIWIAVIVLIWLISYRKILNIKYLIVGGVAFVLVVSPLLYFNNQIYGEMFTLGYLEGNKSIQENVEGGSTLVKIITKPAKILLPSGIDFNKLYETVSKYVVQIFYPYFILCILGLILFLKKINSKKRDEKIYFLTYIITVVFLILYYGSGEYFGASGGKGYTIDSSMIRYWLPVFILSIPFIVFTILRIIKIIKNKKLKIFSVCIIFVMLSVFSFKIVYLESEAGLVKIDENSELYAEIEKEVMDSTDENSVIITSFADKFLFPKRKVMGLTSTLEDRLESEKRWDAVKNLIDKNDIHYFTIYGVDVDELNYGLGEKGLILIPQKAIMDMGSLYKIEKN